MTPAPITKVYFALQNTIIERADSFHLYGPKRHRASLSPNTKEIACVCLCVWAKSLRTGIHLAPITHTAETRTALQWCHGHVALIKYSTW